MMLLCWYAAHYSLHCELTCHLGINHFQFYIRTSKYIFSFPKFSLQRELGTEQGLGVLRLAALNTKREFKQLPSALLSIVTSIVCRYKALYTAPPCFKTVPQQLGHNLSI